MKFVKLFETTYVLERQSSNFKLFCSRWHQQNYTITSQKLLLFKNWLFASFFLWSVILGTSRVTVFAELKGEIHITLIYRVYILNNAQVYFKTNELHALKNYLSNSFLRPKQDTCIIYYFLSFDYTDCI